MDDAAFVGWSIVIVCWVAVGAFFGYQTGQQNLRENICRDTYKGYPHDEGKICLSREDNTKVVITFK